MKRLVPVLALITLVACGGGNETTTPTGPTTLSTEDLVVGTGATAVNGDTVSVFYTGSLLNGQVFDSNVGKTAFTFRLGAGR